MEYVVGGLIGLFVGLLVGWFAWGRRANRLSVCEQESADLRRELQQARSARVTPTLIGGARPGATAVAVPVSTASSAAAASSAGAPAAEAPAAEALAVEGAGAPAAEAPAAEALAAESPAAEEESAATAVSTDAAGEASAAVSGSEVVAEAGASVETAEASAGTNEASAAAEGAAAEGAAAVDAGASDTQESAGIETAEAAEGAGIETAETAGSTAADLSAAGRSSASMRGDLTTDVEDEAAAADAGAVDSGAADAGTVDSGAADSGTVDSAAADAGSSAQASAAELPGADDAAAAEEDDAAVLDGSPAAAMAEADLPTNSSTESIAETDPDAGDFVAPVETAIESSAPDAAVAEVAATIADDAAEAPVAADDADEAAATEPGDAGIAESAPPTDAPAALVGVGLEQPAVGTIETPSVWDAGVPEAADTATGSGSSGAAPVSAGAAPVHAADAAKGDIAEIQGIGPANKQRLGAAGVTTIAGLLDKGATENGRKALAADAGIPTRLILTWVNHADLLRVPGVDPQAAELLEVAGVDSPGELAHRNPANLRAALFTLNESKHIAPEVPAVDALTGWIEAAKGLPKAVTH